MIAASTSPTAENGDTDPVDVRRAKAFTMLATPAYACRVLADATAPATTAPSPGG